MKLPVKSIEYRGERPFAVQIVNAKHYPAERHGKELEIIFCLSGAATIVTAHDRFTIHRDQIVTLDMEDLHCIYSETDNQLAIINMDLTRSGKYAFDDLRYRYFACNPTELHSYNRKYHEKVRAALLSIVYAYAKDLDYSAEQYQKVYEELLDDLVEGFSFPYRNDVEAEMNEKIKERINNIHKYVQQNYRNRITIAELSRLNHISENYLSQFLKRTSYGGFKEMVAYVRCYHAEILMMTSDLTGSEISEEVGFSSTKYYYRWFRRFWKNSPLKHKKWYEKYMDQQDDYYLYEPQEIAPLIEQWIARDLTESVFLR